MRNANLDGVHVSELIGKGLVLHPREAVALVYESCGTAKPFGFPKAAEELWLTESGELHVVLSETANESDARIAAAALLEALLPRASGVPEDAALSGLRSLPERLRRSAAAGGAGTVSDLMFVLKRFMDDSPRSLLHQLATRANRARPAENHDPRTIAPTEPSIASAPVEHPSASTPVEHASASARVEKPRATVPTGRPRATTPTEPRPTAAPFFAPLSASQHTPPRVGPEPEIRTHSQPPPRSEFDPDIFRRDALATDTIAPPVHRTTTGGARWTAAALVLIMASGYAGYTYSRSRQFSRSERPVDVSSATAPGRAGPEESQAPRAGGTAEATDNDTGRRDPSSPSVAETSVMERDRAGDGQSQPVILPVADGAFSPSFAPTGHALVFHSGRSRGRLFEADLDDRGTASHVTPVLALDDGRNAAKDYHPRLSPDGRLVAFDSDRDGERGVYVATRGRADARRVSGNGYAAVPSWSPDMKSLAFVRGEPAQPKVWNLWLLDLASRELSRRTSFRVGQVWGASWFADGHRLCYSHENQLIISNLSTGTTETFQTPRLGRLVRTPAVSPDGRRIVFQVHRDGVWMLDLQTRTMNRILDDATAEEFAWDPDGRRIAYHSRRDGQWRIWITTPPRS